MRGAGSAKGRVAAALLVLTLVGGAACDDEDEIQRGEERGVGDQPAPDSDTFEQGLFDEIPRFRRSEPLGPRSEAEDTDIVTQSFAAIDALPKDVVEFYAQQLPVMERPWDPLRGPEEIADGTWRGVWVRDNWQLTVSAQEAPSLEDALEPDAAQGNLYTQYSLNLEPR